MSFIPPVCSVHEQNNISPAEISQWTNHRVMEWLRSVDLAEYAPNLRGSGVHGGLMVRRLSRESSGKIETPPCRRPLLLPAGHTSTSLPPAGFGAAVQRGDDGFAVEHPSQQDAAAPPPGHTLQPAHWC